MGFKYISAYFKHRFAAKTRHGTHSPFVYKLADEVIYDFSSKKVYEEIEAQRKKLLNDDKTAIWIGKQAKSNLKSPRLLQLVFRLVNYHQPKQIIEIGTGFGLTTTYLAKASPDAKVLSLTGTTEMPTLTEQDLTINRLNNVTLVTGGLEQTFKTIVEKTDTLDLVYVGGRNTKDFSLSIFNLCLAKANEHTILIFDQIYWNKEMQSAWQNIKKHPQVTITIDLFWFGMVYFRKGQAKEHFKLKF